MAIYDKDELYTGFSSGNSSVLDTPSSTPNSGIGMADATGAMDQGMFIPMTGPSEMPAQKQPRQQRGPDWFGWRAKSEARQQRKQHADADHVKATIGMMEQGVKMLEGLEGAERENAATFFGDQLERLSPGMRDTFTAVANRPSILKDFQAILPNLPEHMQVLARRDPKKFLEFAGTATGATMLNEAADRVELRTATKKVQTAMMGMQSLLPPEVASKYGQDGVITSSEIMDMQQYLPKEVRLTEPQIDMLRKHDKSVWTGLGVLSGEQEQKVLADRAKKPKNEPLVKRLMAERDALPKDSPDRKVYDNLITNLQKKGTPQAKPPAAPKPETPAQASAREQAAITAESVDERVSSLLTQLQENPHLVGPAGAVRRTVETGVGVVNPNMKTPALDYQNNLKLLLADVRKVVEKDPNLSNQERRNLMETIGGGTFVTTGSAMRALTEVQKYVSKRSGLTAEPEPTEEDLKFTADKHGISVEEVKRRMAAKKGKK